MSILNEVEISGISLMSGLECRVRLRHSTENGIVFFLNNTKTPIKADVNNVISTDNCVVIGNENVNVRLIEHFMAACAFCNISNIEVHMSGDELPILDGSAKNWVKIFNEQGFSSTDTDKKINLKQPLTLTSLNTVITMVPADSFEITYCVDFEHDELKRKWYNWKSGNHNEEIIEARTFGYLKDLEKFQSMGLALGASVENTVGLTENGYTVELRSTDEPIKHKILDIIGDLYLTGVNPLNFNAHIIAKQAGHKSHIEFAKSLKTVL